MNHVAGQGSIYAGRGDNPYTYLIRAVGNASRVTKSVVIEGLRYGSSPLIDMRIHDINVEADLSRSNPNNPDPEEPVNFDGSEQGLSPKTQAQVDSHLTDASGQVQTWWTGPWPMLHISTNSQFVFHMAVDLLGTAEIYDSSPSQATEEDFNNAQRTWGFAVEIGLWTLALIITCAVAEKIPTGWAAIAAVVSIMLLTLGIAWMHSHTLVDNGMWNAGAAAWFFLLLSLTYLCMAAGYKKVGGIAAYAIFAFLAFIMETSIEAIKAAIQLTVWSRMVFVTMAIVFFIYYSHFYSY
ncbi:MAG: hypothetical protein ACFFD6_03215 [Candidatus Thorarchaeota archaeon]